MRAGSSGLRGLPRLRSWDCMHIIVEVCTCEIMRSMHVSRWVADPWHRACATPVQPAHACFEAALDALSSSLEVHCTQGSQSQVRPRMGYCPTSSV